jgi:hypothetical protein
MRQEQWRIWHLYLPAILLMPFSFFYYGVRLFDGYEYAFIQANSGYVLAGMVCGVFILPPYLAFATVVVVMFRKRSDLFLERLVWILPVLWVISYFIGWAIVMEGGDFNLSANDLPLAGVMLAISYCFVVFYKVTTRLRLRKHQAL